MEQLETLPEMLEGIKLELPHVFFVLTFLPTLFSLCACAHARAQLMGGTQQPTLKMEKTG